MRRLRKGQPTGPALTPISFANDWIQAKPADGAPQILRPQLVVLEEPGDFEFFTSRQDPQNVGKFWEQWTLDRVTGRFTAVTAVGGGSS